MENLKPIDVNVGAGEIELAQKVADEMFEIKLLPKRVNVSERVLH